MKFDGKAFGEQFAEFTRDYVKRELAPLFEQIAALKQELVDARSAIPSEPDIRMIAHGAAKEIVAEMPLAPTAEEIVALIPVPKDGLDGAPGEKGEPGINGKDGRDGIDGKDGAVGEKGEPGRDGVDGKDGEKGIDGRDGAAGPAGIGLADSLLDRDGALVLTMSDGTVKRLGVVVGADGAAGRDGKDGAPGKDGDPELLRSMVCDEVQKQGTAPLATAYKGVWKPDAYKHGDLTTWGGSMWLAKCDTEAKPDTGEDWVLVVKRGRDGKDGELKVPKPPTPVKL